MIGEVVYNIFITPLELIFEVVFAFIYRVTQNPAIAIVGLSLVMNFLVLPLYKRADAMQEAERDKVASMSTWVNHIKKTFNGDERYMMLNTYYRQQNYKPIYALRSSFSLILQIPFFIAAYHYLSNLYLLEGSSFLFLKNLGAPDQLLHIGSLTINIMPIIMTLINFISGYIYLRGFPIKDKIQTYGIGIIFLVLLYNSPSGLVFYWTLNQVFSMLKNVFMKLVKSRKVLNIVFSIAGICIAIVAVLFLDLASVKRVAAVVFLFIICQLPLIASLIRKKLPENRKPVKEVKYSTFLLGGLFLSVFAGAVIPLSVISASPIEFVTKTATPAGIVINNLAIAIGYFVVWFGIFYYLANKKGKRVFSYILWLLAGICVVDFMFFGRNLGTISTFLVFDKNPEYLLKEKILNLGVILVLIAAMILFMYFFERFVPFVYLALVIGAVALSAVNGLKVQKEIRSVDPQTVTASHEREKIIPLSTKGKNVVVIMLDRAISGYLPYIFHEKPEVQEAFEGFTYYPNTISFAGVTNLGAPALFGGYEYRPLSINERPDEKLVDKHNEALKVMPKLFSDNGYRVTVCDPPYAGYMWVSDLSIYDDIPDVHTYHTIGKYQSTEDIEKYSTNSKRILTRNFFFYSLFKSVPVILQNAVYDYGDYYSTTQKFQGMEQFMNSYTVLSSLPELTEIIDTEENTFMMIDNDTTHEPSLLEWPGYTPSVDPDVPHKADDSVYIVDGEQLVFETEEHLRHYDVNMAAYIQLGKWMQFLREQGVYDNTRIIIVSDHGWGIGQFPKLKNELEDMTRYNPILLVKDFNAAEYSVSDRLMTNADAAVIAVSGLVDDPHNPYTGKPLDDSAKYTDELIITASHNWETDKNNGNVFDLSDAAFFKVHDNIFDSSNWSYAEP